ncbi:hypothetical protein [Achromobacter ruhlandii]|uniref:hypothetical protein n=1 Tax=Achromobacter ruhlandii TaxID=72557 RepID=UPI003BA05DCC
MALQVVVDVVSSSRRPRRRAGQVLALQVVVDVASSSMRPAAVRRPGASAAGRGDRGLRFAAVAGALAGM